MNEDILGKMVTGPSGRHLGRVAVAEEGRFSVEVEGQMRWLPRDVIFSVEETSVTVIFEPNALDRYAIGPSGPASERAG